MSRRSIIIDERESQPLIEEQGRATENRQQAQNRGTGTRVKSWRDERITGCEDRARLHQLIPE